MLKMKVFFLFLSSFFSLFIFAQDDFSFEAKISRKQIGENENVRIEFSMNQNGDNFSPPTFEGFSVIMGPSQSVSQSIINGKQNFQKSFSYVLSPKRKGKITIGSASVEYNGKIYKTKPISLEVTDPVKNPKTTQSNSHSMNMGGFPSSILGQFFGEDDFDEAPQQTEIKNDDLRLIAEITNTSPYLNEAVSVTYKILFSNNIGIRGFRVSKNPEYPSFYKEEIPIKQQEVSQTQYKGKTYRSVPISKVLLYPQKTGQIIIKPLEGIIDLEVVTGQGFFGRQIGSVSKQISSGDTFINVKALPEEGKPENFSGAVGVFSIKATVEKNKIRTGETLSSKITLSGKGNFNLIELPSFTFPASFESYDPEKKEDLQTSHSGVSGSVTNIHTVIPQHKGNYSIPAVSFSFFNPNTKKYVTLSTQSLTISVAQGHFISQGKGVSFSSEQFMYLKTKSDWQSTSEKNKFDTPFFWIIWLLPLLGIPVGIFGWNRYKNLQNDSDRNRRLLADRLARKYLSSAKKSFNNKNDFYEHLERGLHNYLKAKLHIETSELSKERIEAILNEKNVAPNTILQTLDLFSNCEKARYAPYTQTDIENDYNKASEVISLLHKQIR